MCCLTLNFKSLRKSCNVVYCIFMLSIRTSKKLVLSVTLFTSILLIFSIIIKFITICPNYVPQLLCKMSRFYLMPLSVFKFLYTTQNRKYFAMHQPYISLGDNVEKLFEVMKEETRLFPTINLRKKSVFSLVSFSKWEWYCVD